MPDAAAVSSRLKEKASELGFQPVGICHAVAPQGASLLQQWLARGYAGQMHYLADRYDAYQHPSHVLAGVRSLVMLGLPYAPDADEPPPAGHGRVARYAWGSADYHEVIRPRLHQLADTLRTLVPDAQTRGVVDTAPLLEREFAMLAGLGWVGKNTLLLNRGQGSYFFLAALLTDVELLADTPHTADHCGSCTACLDACPTAAFPAPYVLDASRCISYLTIELRDHVPADLRRGMEDWVYGCDVCQEVCPWNRFAPPTREAAFLPVAERHPLELTRLFDLDDAEFRREFRHLPLWRPHRRGLLRSAAIVLGNQRHLPAVGALTRGLHDCEAVVRAAAAWALGQLGSRAARNALQERGRLETDPEVQREIATALAAGV